MHHGSKGFEVTAPRSRFYHGGFGRLFQDLEPWSPPGVKDEDLESFFLKFANLEMIEVPGLSPEDIAARDSAVFEGDPLAPLPGEDVFNSTTPSGYVYFGQFIDHDLTLDVTPLSDAQVDPNRLQNFRTPRFDLDSLYGLGPDAQPYLYERQNGAVTGKLLHGSVDGAPFPDLLRLQNAGQASAIIGDPRNDENAIVAQLHLAFLLAHNRLVDVARSELGLKGDAAFARARKTLHWLYQWIVWHDFVARICREEVHQTALRQEIGLDGRTNWKLGYEDDVYSWKNDPFMPVEFSVGAYRFGHSMVRNGYRTNFSAQAGLKVVIPIFSKTKDDLRGGEPISLRRVVQWDWFLRMSSSVQPAFPQRARKIDTKLSNALMHLPEDATAPGDERKILNVLAARNLVRGVRMKLPAGPDVAKALNVAVLPLEAQEPKSLWYYVLKEAGSDDPSIGGAGNSLGMVGSIIVAATFAGILKGDPLSYLSLEPGWEPSRDELLAAAEALALKEGKPSLTVDGGIEQNPAWGLPAIIRLSGLPVDGNRFQPPLL
jgi:hypothetical protein